MWITGKGNILIIIGVYFVFFEVESPRALPAAMVLYVREKSCLIDELVKLLWTTLRTSAVTNLSALPSLRRGDLCANNPAYSTHISSGTMGHGPFHCITPLLTSGAHGLPTFIEVSPTFGCHSPAQPLKTHQIDFTDWITLPVLCVCMFMCWQYVLKDIHGQQWQG